ncbi:MAG: hypothetical protein IT285_12860 [Bdellovibrionales bacterium]|nr:hypothetical protein [Bdellovibrionales bacterium]
MKATQLIFVYAADSGTLNALIDVAHKIVSPKTYACNLCGLTYGILSEKREWAEFRARVQEPMEFLHRDEFKLRFPRENPALPVVLRERAGRLETLATAEDINRCTDTSALIALIEGRLGGGAAK